MMMMCDFPSCVAKRTLPPYDSLPTHHHPNCPAFLDHHIDEPTKANFSSQSALNPPTTDLSKSNSSAQTQSAVCDADPFSHFYILIFFETERKNQKELSGIVHNLIDNQNNEGKLSLNPSSGFFLWYPVNFDCVQKSTFAILFLPFFGIHFSVVNKNLPCLW